MIKVDELANSLQVCLDSGAKKVLLPITSAADLATVPAELVGSFNLIFYSSAQGAGSGVTRGHRCLILMKRSGNSMIFYVKT